MRSGRERRGGGQTWATFVRLEPVLSKQIRNAPAREPDLLAEQPRGPSASARRRGRHRELNDSLDRLTRHGVVLSPRLRARRETSYPLRSEPRSDPRDLLPREIQTNSYLHSRDAVGAE